MMCSLITDFTKSECHSNFYQFHLINRYMFYTTSVIICSLPELDRHNVEPLPQYSLSEMSHCHIVYTSYNKF